MNILHSRTLLVACSALGAAVTASAEQFSVEADVIFQGCCISRANSAAAVPVNAAVPLVFSPDGTRSGLASASAGPGQVTASGASASVGGKVTSIGLADATFDDVLFRFVGSGPAPSFIASAALNYQVAASQAASGFLGTLGGFNSRELNYSISFGSGADSGSVTWDVTGDVGQSLLGGHKLVSTQVPVGLPVSVHLDLNAGAQATLRSVGSPVNTGISAVLGIGEATLTPIVAPPESSGFAPTVVVLDLTAPVFDLPEGFTVDSVSMGVVDNHWIFAPVPEPATAWLLLAGALLLLAGPLRGSRVSSPGAVPGCAPGRPIAPVSPRRPR